MTNKVMRLDCSFMGAIGNASYWECLWCKYLWAGCRKICRVTDGIIRLVWPRTGRERRGPARRQRPIVYLSCKTCNRKCFTALCSLLGVLPALWTAGVCAFHAGVWWHEFCKFDYIGLVHGVLYCRCVAGTDGAAVVAGVWFIRTRIIQYSLVYAIDRVDPTPNDNSNPNYDPELRRLIFITPPVVFVEGCITISVWHKNDLLSNSKIPKHCWIL